MKMLRLFRLNLRAGLASASPGVDKLAFIEEVGVALVALVEILRRVLRRHLVWILRAAERDLRRLIVDGIEGLQRLMRRQRTRDAIDGACPAGER